MPRRRLTAVLIVLMLGTAAAFCQQPLKPDLTPVTMTAQDAGGNVWGVAQGRPGRAFRWQKGRWAPQPVDTARSFPLGVWTGPGGGVIIIWGQQTQQGSPVVWRRGDQRKLLGFIPSPGIPRVFPAPADTVWIPAADNKVYRLGQDGSPPSGYALPPSMPFVQRRGRGVFFAPLEATADGQGRTWFWIDAVSGVSNWLVSPGFAIFNGSSFEFHPAIDGLPDGGVTFLGRADNAHLWAAIFRDGLYSIDITKLSAQRIPDPEPGAFQRVTKIFRDGQDTYVISLTPPRDAWEIPGHRLTSALWRLRAGHWKKVLAGVDDLPEAGSALERARLQGQDGLWLGSYGAGLWFVASSGPPGSAPPELIDWRQGFPITSVDRLYPLDNGRMLAVQLERGGQPRESRAVAFDAPSVLHASTPPKTIQVLDPYTSLEEDQQFRVWGILTLSGRALDEWDGEKWTAHPLPGAVDPAWISGADADSTGRIWLFPGCQIIRPVGIFDPHAGNWTPYPSYPEALESESGHPVRFVNASEDRLKPVYGPASQIVFNGACTGINYFDGSRWRLWNWNQMPGTPVAPFASAAFFDPAGKLAVNINRETWELEPRAGWHIIGYQPHPVGMVRWFVPSPSQPPPSGCSETQSSSMARDRLGRSWWTWQGSVYEGVAGLCRAVFAANQPQPFIDGRLLRRVLIDSKGNVFFETLLANNRLGEYVVWLPPGPPPRTTIRATQPSPASVRVDFSTTAAGKALFTWRLDGGAWSAPQAQSSAVVDGLSSGSHTIEAASIDAMLRMDPVPAAVSVTVRGETPQQIVALIAQLAHAANDDQRESAVRAIAAQPPAVALPALRAARAAASEDVRWWIDAAIQQLEQKQGASQ
ncbi:MAG: hypothetical protein ACRD1N_02135 [Terriglobia bacterium]